MIRKGNSTSGADFSECDKYRFALWRTWTDNATGKTLFGRSDGSRKAVGDLSGRLCAFIGLNPSTATHEVDDPTIRRCVRFCKDWGFDGYVMLNLFAFRATDPKVMKAERYPVGHMNGAQILYWAKCCERVVCAWGNHGSHLRRSLFTLAMLRTAGIPLHHMGLTGTGEPKHPLYLAKATEPILWQ